MRRVLILGSNDRAALAVARSLGRAGKRIEIARMGESTVAERSRHVDATVDIGSPMFGVLPVAHRLLDALSQRAYSLVIPINDTACVLANEFRDQIQAYAPLALPEKRAFEATHDKGKTLALCDELGIPRPPSLFLMNWEDVNELATQPELFPAYVKPCFSARIVSGRMATFRVVRVESFEQLEEQARFYLDKVPFLLQKPAQGVGTGLHFLAAEGKILSIVQQQRIHEPRSGGGGSYRQTVPLDPRYLGWANAIAGRLGWHGVAMVELKVDPSTSAASLMEINGRFWGSLPLTLRAGLDLPAQLFDMYHEKQSPPHVREARIHIRQRNLRRDILWVVREARSKRGRERAWLIAAWLADFAYILSGREGLDTESLTDPRPALSEWGEMSRSALRSILRRIPHKLKLKTPPSAAEERLRLTRALTQLGKTPRLLFVCKGNICRSAFAEAYCRQVFGWQDVSSAGLLEQFDRRPPRVMEEIARRLYGVNLSAHRSRALEQDMLSWADMVFVMEEGMVKDVEEGRLRFRPFVLGHLVGEGDIRDPLHLPEELVGSILNRLVASLEALRINVPGDRHRFVSEASAGSHNNH